MIDIENQIFNKVASALRDKFSKVFVTGEYTHTPSNFPYVSIVEADNSIVLETSDSSNIENHNEVMYQINICTNNVKGRKKVAKDLLQTVDGEFTKMGFNRLSAISMVMENATIYQLVVRYTAIVDKNERIYRR